MTLVKDEDVREEIIKTVDVARDGLDMLRYPDDINKNLEQALDYVTALVNSKHATNDVLNVAGWCMNIGVVYAMVMMLDLTGAIHEPDKDDDDEPLN